MMDTGWTIKTPQGFFGMYETYGEAHGVAITRYKKGRFLIVKFS